MTPLRSRLSKMRQQLLGDRRLRPTAEALNADAMARLLFGDTGKDLVAAGKATDFRIFVDVHDAAVGQVIAETNEWEPHTSSVIRQFVKPGMVMIDIGANVGWFSLLAAGLVGPTGRVIAVEPWSENCRLLILSTVENKLDNIELWPIALDQRLGWTNFMIHIGSNGGMIPESQEAIASGHGCIMPVFTLDSLLATENVDFVKIDVEGAEHRVLLGAQETLERCRPVIMSEFSIEMLQRVSGANPENYLSWFSHRGWSLHVIDRASPGELIPFSSPDDLLAWWPDMFHIEDLLLLPMHR